MDNAVKNTDPYAALKPIPGEDTYVDYDEEFDCWGLFGSKSGFCYTQAATREELAS